MRGALELFQTTLGTKDVPGQVLEVFLFIASRSPGQVPLGEVEKVLGLTQTSASRVVGYLATGNAARPEGYRLVQVESDPYYVKRKLIVLTSRGHALAARMAEALSEGM